MNLLKTLQNHAARVITKIGFDAQSRLLIEGLGWISIDDLIGIESKIVVNKSVNDLAPQYKVSQ